MKSVRTWVLIADAGRARVLESRGPGTGLHAVDGLSFAQDTPPSRELGRDQPPRSFDSVGSGRHAMEPRNDPHRAQKLDFARQLADVLGAALAQKSFDKLVVVAPPPFLGDLRGVWPAPVAAAIVGEIAKDLTKAPTLELEAQLGDTLRL
jgi:protein required for attachment to host cells